jgi:hypothetical protein
LAQYLQSREKNIAEEAFAAEMRRGAAVRLFLAEPEQPVYSINIDDQPVRGNPSAPVAKTYEALKQALEATLEAARKIKTTSKP